MNKKTILTIVLVSFAAITGLACSSAGSNSGSGPLSNSNPLSSNKPAATTTPSKPAAPKTLLKVSGNGIKKSAKFTTGSDWTLAYTYDCTKTFGGQGNFQVMLYTNGNLDDILVNELGAKGNDSVPDYSAGEHYLEMNSECSWTVTVTG